MKRKGRNGRKGTRSRDRNAWQLMDKKKKQKTNEQNKCESLIIIHIQNPSRMLKRYIKPKSLNMPAKMQIYRKQIIT
ncbi:hypothetical protein I7I53_00660 [Histoplasma capsulatum var. duboisii H88]|uniref:Uncharacterized protein n=1 Tax=Ajellomyces capsulatus (strain H88) TaxID=544711 RepID=A0A8A1LHL5_AJEC8|nr:hypothetical protein I7I53_00660 [Histoplasma capsulatum var. duboisii H88]